MRRHSNHRKASLKLILFILLISIGLGYAFLHTDLTIAGIYKIRDNDWDIHFESINDHYYHSNVHLSSEYVAAVIDPTTRTRIDCTVTFNEPGDFYEFTVNVVNAGSIDGMLDSAIMKVNDSATNELPAYLDYSITYDDGSEIGDNDILGAGEVDTLKVIVSYKKDISASDLPSTSESTSLSFEMSYIQADGSGNRRLVPFYETFGSVKEQTLNSSWQFFLEGRGKVLFATEDLYVLKLYENNKLVKVLDNYIPLSNCLSKKESLENEYTTESIVCEKIVSTYQPYILYGRAIKGCIKVDDTTLCYQPNHWDCEYDSTEGTCTNTNGYVMQKKTEAENAGLTCSFEDYVDDGGPKSVTTPASMLLVCNNSMVGFNLISTGVINVYEFEVAACRINDDYTGNCGYKLDSDGK